MKFHWLKKANFDSATLLMELRKQTQSALDKIYQAFAFVANNNLQDECILVGGMAVAHWTSRVITPDIDFLCGDIEAVKAKLSKDCVEFSSVTFANLGTEGGFSVPLFDADFLDPRAANMRGAVYDCRDDHPGRRPCSTCHPEICDGKNEGSGRRVQVARRVRKDEAKGHAEEAAA